MGSVWLATVAACADDLVQGHALAVAAGDDPAGLVGAVVDSTTMPALRAGVKLWHRAGAVALFQQMGADLADRGEAQLATWACGVADALAVPAPDGLLLVFAAVDGLSAVTTIPLRGVAQA